MPAAAESWTEQSVFARRLGADVDPWSAELCARALVAQATGAEDADVRAFLRGPDGAAFVDGVAAVMNNGAPLRLAVGATVARWMAFEVDAGTARALEVPPGLPLLVGSVMKAARGAGLRVAAARPEAIPA